MNTRKNFQLNLVLVVLPVLDWNYGCMVQVKYPYTIDSVSQQPPKHGDKCNNSLISIKYIVPATAVVL